MLYLILLAPEDCREDAVGRIRKKGGAPTCPRKAYGAIGLGQLVLRYQHQRLLSWDKGIKTLLKGGRMYDRVSLSSPQSSQRHVPRS